VYIEDFMAVYLIGLNKRIQFARYKRSCVEMIELPNYLNILKDDTF